MDTRTEFEEWIAGPPYELSVERWPLDPHVAWPGCYKDIAVDLAWHAWCAARGCPMTKEDEYRKLHGG